MHCTEIIQITNPLKDLVSSVQSVNINRISESAIMKNGHHFINIEKIQIINPPSPPPQSLDFFGASTEMGYLHRPL